MARSLRHDRLAWVARSASHAQRPSAAGAGPQDRYRLVGAALPGQLPSRGRVARVGAGPQFFGAALPGQRLGQLREAPTVRG